MTRLASLDSVASRRTVQRVTWVGLLVNVTLSIAKFIAGLVGNSQAVMADGVHSLSDLVSDIAILVGVRYWSAPADIRHPYGHGRIETVITALIGLLLVVVAIGLGGRALLSIYAPPPGEVRWIAFWAALLSIILKEAIFWWSLKAGRKIRSSALIANAWHHRSDALSSIPAALAVAGSAINPAWFFLDHVGALLVSLFIMRAAWHIIQPELSRLIDAGVSRETQARILRLTEQVPGVREAHALRTRHIGSGYQLDLHVLVNGDLTVREGHDISRVVEANVLDDDNDIVDVTVHIEPWEESARDSGPTDAHL